MVEVYSLVEVKKSGAKKLMSVFILLVSLCVLGFSLMSARLGFFILFILFAALWFFVTFKTSMEYEISYFDGEFRFAKVINKSRRKKIGTFTTDEMMQLAPSEDRSVSNYMRDNSVRKYDYTSKTGAPCYALVRRNSDQVAVYLMELDEKFLDEVCKKNGAKVIR